MDSTLQAMNVKIEAGASMRDAELMAAAQPSPDELLAGDVGRYALFLDCDGTLLDIAPTPNEVHVPDGLVELLVGLSKRLDGALAVLTGRPSAMKAANVAAIASPAPAVPATVASAAGQ